MLKKGVYKTQKEIGERNGGLSEPQVNKIINLVRIPERLMKLMASDKRTSTMAVAYPVSQIFERCKEDPERAEQVAEYVIEEVARDAGLNRDAVRDLIESKLEQPGPDEKQKRTRENPLSNQVKYGDYKGVLKVFPSRGQLNLTFSNLTPEKVEELQDRINNMLAGQASL